MNPCQGCFNPSSLIVRCLRAGSQGTFRAPGLATSRSNSTPIASKISGGVNHSVVVLSKSICAATSGLSIPPTVAA